MNIAIEVLAMRVLEREHEFLVETISDIVIRYDE